MFYISTAIAILGAVGYQYFVKRVPAGINPVVSVIGTYIAVLILGITLLPFFRAEGGLSKHIKQLSWIQLAVAASIFMLELGFLLMYRYGWDLGTGNLVTSVIINIILLILGVTVLNEMLIPLNMIGVVTCIIGVVLVSYRP
jgi:drug/metabolite transporter (DMT)-like permease